MPRSDADLRIKTGVFVDNKGVKKSTRELNQHVQAMRAFKKSQMEQNRLGKKGATDRGQIVQAREQIFGHLQSPEFKRLVGMAERGHLPGVNQRLVQRARNAFNMSNMLLGDMKKGKHKTKQFAEMKQFLDREMKAVTAGLKGGYAQISAIDKSKRRQQDLLRKKNEAAERQKRRDETDARRKRQAQINRDYKVATQREQLARRAIQQRDAWASVDPRYLDKVYGKSGLTTRQHFQRTDEAIRIAQGRNVKDQLVGEDLARINTLTKDQTKSLNEATKATNRLGRAGRMVTGVLARMGIAYGGFLVFQGVIDLMRTGFEWTVGWARELQNVRARMTGLSGSAWTSEKALRTAMESGRGTPFTLEEVSRAAAVFTGRGVTATPDLLRTAQATSIVLDQPLEQVVNNIAKLSIRSANLKRGLVQLGISWAAFENQIAMGKSNLEAITTLLSRNQAVLGSYAATWDTVWKNFRQNIGNASEGLAGAILNTFQRYIQRWNIQMEGNIPVTGPNPYNRFTETSAWRSHNIQLARNASNTIGSDIFERFQYGTAGPVTKFLIDTDSGLRRNPLEVQLLKSLSTPDARDALLNFDKSVWNDPRAVSDRGPLFPGNIDSSGGAIKSYLEIAKMATRVAVVGGFRLPHVGKKQIEQEEGTRIGALVDESKTMMKDFNETFLRSPLESAMLNLKNIEGQIAGFQHQRAFSSAHMDLVDAIERKRTTWLATKGLVDVTEATMPGFTAGTDDFKKLVDFDRQIERARKLQDETWPLLKDDPALTALIIARKKAKRELYELERAPMRKLREEWREEGLAEAIPFVPGELPRRPGGAFHDARIIEMGLLERIGLGVDPDRRQLLEMNVKMAREKYRQPLTGNALLQAEVDYLEAQGALENFQEPRGPGYRLGMTGVGALRSAFTGVDWGGNRNRQLDKQIEALRRQKMEIEGQIEPLTQQELIETRINELYAQRLGLMEQFGNQLRAQAGSLLVRGIFGGIGALIGSAGGAGGAAAGFNIGFGQDIFRGASGYGGVVDEPTLFLAGEAGEERVSITPDGVTGEGGGPMFIFNNPTITADKAAFLKMLRETGFELQYGGHRIRGINDG